jgi:hypothetical protein
MFINSSNKKFFSKKLFSKVDFEFFHCIMKDNIIKL